jgi:hypothetical protein
LQRQNKKMNMPDEGFEVAYMKEAEDFLNGLT